MGLPQGNKKAVGLSRGLVPDASCLARIVLKIKALRLRLAVAVLPSQVNPLHPPVAYTRVGMHPRFELHLTAWPAPCYNVLGQDWSMGVDVGVFLEAIR